MIKNEMIDGVGPWLWPNTDTSGDGGLWAGPLKEWYLHKELIQKYCRDTNVVVQAGGACGMYPRLLANFFQVVYTFEPHVGNFSFLCKNADLPNIFKFNAALGDTHEMIAMHTHDSNQGMHRVDRVVNATVPTLRIDDFKYPTLDLIMLDVESYEINVLRGAVISIEKFKPLIIVENATKEIIDFLEQFNYNQVDQNASDSYFRVKG